MKTLSIHLTDLCNNRCIFCVVGVPGLEGETIAAEEVHRTLLAKAGQGYDAVNLHGGEPTVRGDLLETLQLIRELGYPEVHIQTNGRKLRDAGYTRTLYDLGVALFIISVHGLAAQTHDWHTRVKGGFAQAMRAIENAKDVGGRVRTNTVVTRQNLSELPAIVDMLIDLGVDHVNISNLHPAHTAPQHFELLIPTVEEMQPWVQRAVERALVCHVPVTLEGFALCTIPGLEAYHLESVRQETISMEFRGQWIDDYNDFMNSLCRVKGVLCTRCVYDENCGGVYREYAQARGWSEFRPVSGPRL